MGCGTSTPVEIDKEHTYGPSTKDQRHSVIYSDAAPACAESMHHRSDCSSESEGEHTEEGDTILSIRKKLLVFKARVRHGINDDPNQFEDTARARVSDSALTAIRNYVDDHIKASLEADLGMGEPLCGSIWTGPRTHSGLQSSENDSVSRSTNPEVSNTSTLGLSAVATIDGTGTTGTEQPLPGLLSADDLIPGMAPIPESPTTSELLPMPAVLSVSVEQSSTSDDRSFSAGGTPKVSSHYHLPPMTLRHRLDISAIQFAAMNEEELDTQLASFLLKRRAKTPQTAPLAPTVLEQDPDSSVTPPFSRSLQAMDFSVSPRKNNAENDSTGFFTLSPPEGNDSVTPPVEKLEELAVTRVNEKSWVCGRQVVESIEAQRPGLRLRWLLFGSPITKTFDSLCASRMASLLASDV